MRYSAGRRAVTGAVYSQLEKAADEIDRRAAEVKSLTIAHDQCAELRRLLAEERDELAARCAELKRDAVRYQRLKFSASDDESLLLENITLSLPEKWDAMIDASIDALSADEPQKPDAR